MQTDHYSILGVQPDADLETIRRAYKRRAFECHPDHGGSHAQMVRVIAAWEVLSDPVLRGRYDQARTHVQDPVANAAANEDTRQACDRAAQYPQKWSDFELWLEKVTRDFASAEYKTVDGIYGTKWPVITGSETGMAFVVAGGILGSVVGIALAYFFIAVLLKPNPLFDQLLNKPPENPGFFQGLNFQKVWIGAMLLITTTSAGAGIGAQVHKWIRYLLLNRRGGNSGSKSPEATAGAASPSMAVIRCSKCGQRLRVRIDVGRWKIRCPKCHYRFFHDPIGSGPANPQPQNPAQVEPRKATPSVTVTKIPYLGWIIGGVLVVLLFLVFRYASTSVGGAGLSKELLPLATVTLRGAWHEDDSPFGDDQEAWSGTAFVTERHDDTLVLYTNKHCLGLDSLARADNDAVPEIRSYSLWVHFPTGVDRSVLRMAPESSNLDLARLEVASNGLVEGKDYVVVPTSSRVTVAVGDRVVAVGTPLGTFAGTETFGRVSAIRDFAPLGMRCRVIQHDAAINHGNSGGPLFLESGNLMVWVGVNTWSANKSVAEGINFSIAAEQARSAEYVWAPADPLGAAQLIRKLYGVKAIVSSLAR